MRFRLTLGLLAMATGVWAQAVDEYQVKAAFLYNFAKFVDWPPQSFRSAADPISICVFGVNPFGHSLEDAISGKSVGGRTFTVRPIAKMAQATGNCQILFIAGSRKPPPDTPIGGVLTVGDADGFAESGGVIGFRLDEGKVRLDVNVEAAEQRKLRISSKLLSLARIVRTDK